MLHPVLTVIICYTINYNDKSVFVNTLQRKKMIFFAIALNINHGAGALHLLRSG